MDRAVIGILENNYKIFPIYFPSHWHNWVLRKRIFPFYCFNFNRKYTMIYLNESSWFGHLIIRFCNYVEFPNLRWSRIVSISFSFVISHLQFHSHLRFHSHLQFHSHSTSAIWAKVVITSPDVTYHNSLIPRSTIIATKLELYCAIVNVKYSNYSHPTE